MKKDYDNKVVLYMRSSKRLKYPENLFSKSLQLIGVY